MMSATVDAQPSVAPPLAWSPPPATGRVVDAAGLLGEADEAALVAQLVEIDARTSVEVAVVTVPTLGGLPARAYARRLAREWGIGEAGLNNGVMVLIGPGEMYVAVGTGLEWQLPDSVVSGIVVQMADGFRAGLMAESVQDGVADLAVRATAVPWDVRYASLSALPEERTRAVGAVVSLRGLWSAAGDALIVGREVVSVSFPPYWSSGRPADGSTVLARLVSASPLAVEVLGVAN